MHIKTSRRCSARTSRWVEMPQTVLTSNDTFDCSQIETIFQRIPQGVNHINRLQLSNTNGHSNVHPRDSTFRYNLINNNASSNNNNINQQSSNHTVAEPQLQQSHSSDGTMMRSVSALRSELYQSNHNDHHQRRSENYQTTSEGSTSPESSSESSAEEWESGELWTLHLRSYFSCFCLR